MMVSVEMLRAHPARHVARPSGTLLADYRRRVATLLTITADELRPVVAARLLLTGDAPAGSLARWRAVQVNGVLVEVLRELEVAPMRLVVDAGRGPQRVPRTPERSLLPAAA